MDLHQLLLLPLHHLLHFLEGSLYLSSVVNREVWHQFKFLCRSSGSMLNPLLNMRRFVTDSACR